MPEEEPGPDSRPGKSHPRDSDRRRRSVREAGDRGKVDGTEGSAVDLVDEDQVGIIRINSSGVIVESNSRGREILSGEGGLRTDKGRLQAQRPQDEEALQSLLESVLSGDANGRRGGRVVVGRWPDPRPLTVCVKRAGDGDAGVAALVFLVDPWRPAQLSPEHVAKSLRLTPAESRVAVGLAEGRTAEQIAEATGKAIHTVRSLVQQAREKTYSPRQADLVRLVLTSSHLPIAQWE